MSASPGQTSSSVNAIPPQPQSPSASNAGPGKLIGTISEDRTSKEGHKLNVSLKVYGPIDTDATGMPCDIEVPSDMRIRYFRGDLTTTDATEGGFTWPGSIIVKHLGDSLSWQVCSDGDLRGEYTNPKFATGQAASVYFFESRRATPKHPKGDFTNVPDLYITVLAETPAEVRTNSCKGGKVETRDMTETCWLAPLDNMK